MQGYSTLTEQGSLYDDAHGAMLTSIEEKLKQQAFNPAEVHQRIDAVLAAGGKERRRYADLGRYRGLVLEQHIEMVFERLCGEGVVSAVQVPESAGMRYDQWGHVVFTEVGNPGKTITELDGLYGVGDGLLVVEAKNGHASSGYWVKSRLVAERFGKQPYVMTVRHQARQPENSRRQYVPHAPLLRGVMIPHTPVLERLAWFLWREHKIHGLSLEGA